MAWYEMNAGGIPASLKSDMNSVLNKKFGTVSQDYPPNGWPADVNLMGPLPEKTASGAIASFPDGADTVPVKSCTVAFGPGGGGGTPADPVALVGYNSVNVVKAGKNLLDETQKTVASASVWRFYKGNELLLNAGTYTVSANEVCNGIYVRLVDNTDYATSYNVNSCTFTVYTTTAFSFTFSRTAGFDGVTFQLEVGATATAYTPFVTPETISDSFGQTVYGGERDLVTDGMKRTWKKKTVSELTWNVAQIGTSGIYRLTTASLANEIKKPASNSSVADILASIYTALTANATYSQNVGISVNTAGNIYIYDSNYNQSTSANAFVVDFGAQEIAYALDTAEDITGLTAHDIETNYADNNFYADIPDSTMTVEYRADIPLALNA